MKCECGGMKTIYVREDIFEMEAIDQTFEQEKGVLDECLKELPVLLDISFEFPNTPFNVCQWLVHGVASC
jgi:hypothetical protein